MPDRSDHPGPEPTGGNERDDLAELRTFARGRRIEPVSWDEPPDGLWDRIAQAAGVPTNPTETDLTSTDPAETDLTATDLAPTEPAAAGPSPTGDGTVVRPRPARWVRPGLLAAAAVLVAAVASIAILRPWDRSPDETLLASTPLEPLAQAGTGRAELIERSGTMQLRLDTAELDADADGFYEVWVIDPGVSQLVSLGPLRGDGIYDLPAGLDPEAFPVVDVSIEPLDGDPTHSGNSVLRGQLRF